MGRRGSPGHRTVLWVETLVADQVQRMRLESVCKVSTMTRTLALKMAKYLKTEK